MKIAHRGLRRAAAGGSLLGILLAGGCMRSHPPNYYTLATLAPRTEVAVPPLIGIGPVSIPIHLRQPALVARRDPYALDYLDIHQWAQPLEDALPEVIGENLLRLTGADRVVYFPWRSSEAITHQVSFRVYAFELDAGGRAVFEARWSLQDGAGQHLDSGLIALNEDVSHDPAAAPAALSRLLLRFCRELRQRMES